MEIRYQQNRRRLNVRIQTPEIGRNFMKTHRMIGMLAASAALVLTSVNVHASALVSSFSGTPHSDGYTQYEMGYGFIPTRDILVTQLGFVDVGGATLATSHNVNLWQANPPIPPTGNQTETGFSLGSVTVEPTSQLIGDFRYELLSSPITLIAGTAYVLSANIYAWSEAGSDPYYTPITYSLGLPVTMNGGQFNNTFGTFPAYWPAWPNPGTVYITANLIGEVIPEPSIVMLLAAGGWLVWGRRNHSR